jgi:hypothetical protein
MLQCCDTIDFCLGTPRGSDGYAFDLSFCSPPYEDARTYGIDFALKGDAWVQWAADRFCAQYEATRGLTAWVVAGRTSKFAWSATPVLLIAELHKRGVKLRNPPIYHRVGIPGGGGPDWLRSDYEWIVCASHGKLPWSDNTAMGHEPKYAVGGAMSNRHKSGRRINSQLADNSIGKYSAPAKANPGNVIKCVVGGGLLGSDLAHENEAPFPESLAEFFVRSFCPPNGLVYDGFCGSGTTLAVAIKNGRRAVGTDIRESQIELTRRRIHESQNSQQDMGAEISSDSGAAEGVLR